MTDKTKFWAAVEGYGGRNIFKELPTRKNDYSGEWESNSKSHLFHIKIENFPDITWQDEPVEVELVVKTNTSDDFLSESIKVLNWQGGNRHQVLRVIAAARDVACACKTSEVTGSYDNLPTYLDILVKSFE